MKKGCLTTTVILLLIVAIVVIALAAVTDGFNNWDASTWFGLKKDNKQTDSDTQPDGNGGAVIDNVTEQGIKLASVRRLTAEEYADYGVAPTALDSYELNATIEPVTAANKAVDWSVAWADASGEWASGKTVTDYITVSSGTSLTTIVTCNQAFAGQVVVTCSSQENAEIKATCTVDFRQKLAAVALTMYDGNGHSYAITDHTEIPCLDTAYFGMSIEKTAGTIENNFTSFTLAQFNTNYARALEQNFVNWGTGYDKVLEIKTDGTTSNSIKGLYMALLNPTSPGSGYNDKYMLANIINFTNNNSGDLFTFTTTVTDSEGNNTVFTYDVELGDIVVPVGQLTLSDTGIIF